MKALVTGGAGFIGSNLVDALLDAGHTLAIVDNLSTGREQNLEAALARGAILHRADIRDGDELRDILAAEAPEVVFHLAAQIDVRKSLDDPAFDARVNVEGTVNVLEAARVTGVGRIINVSTGGAIYGEVPPDLIPTPETADPKPMAAYGQSKFCAERYCGWYERLYGLPTVTLRLGNVYGPRQDPLGEAGVIAIFCGRLAAGGRPTIYGDGTQTRDYVYVGDVVGAALAAAARAWVRGELNVGTGRETSVLELVDALRGAAGLAESDFEPEFAPPRLGEIQRSCLDVGRAREVLEWEAKVSLREGMRATLEAADAAIQR
jgi:UDP-glucose 4-epimerase